MLRSRFRPTALWACYIHINTAPGEELLHGGHTSAGTMHSVFAAVSNRPQDLACSLSLQALAAFAVNLLAEIEAHLGQRQQWRLSSEARDMLGTLRRERHCVPALNCCVVHWCPSRAVPGRRLSEAPAAHRDGPHTNCRAFINASRSPPGQRRTGSGAPCGVPSLNTQHTVPEGSSLRC